MSKQRLTRKDIKEQVRHDQLQSVLSRIYDQLHDHRQAVIALVVAVVVAIAGGIGAVTYMKYRHRAAAAELTKAMELYSAPIKTEGAQPDDPKTPSFASDAERLDHASQSMTAIHGGAAGEVAELYLADIASQKGDTATARSIWEKFLKSHDEHDVLAVSVRLNLIVLDRQEGKAEQVAENLKAELDKTAKSLPEDVLLFELAQTLDSLNKSDEAKEYYQRILDDYPRSPYATKAREATATS